MSRISCITENRNSGSSEINKAGLSPPKQAKNEKMARAFLAELDSLLPEPNGWIFGKKPTALDAHLIVFIARMTDVGRENLIPDKIKKYGKWAMGGAEWAKVMDGRQGTMVPVDTK